MANKKKTTSARVAKHSKAGNRRDVHKPVMRKEKRVNQRTGEVYFVTVESHSNMRRGQGSNKPSRYNGHPTVYFV